MSCNSERRHGSRHGHQHSRRHVLTGSAVRLSTIPGSLQRHMNWPANGRRGRNVTRRYTSFARTSRSDVRSDPRKIAELEMGETAPYARRGRSVGFHPPEPARREVPKPPSDRRALGRLLCSFDTPRNRSGWRRPRHAPRIRSAAHACLGNTWRPGASILERTGAARHGHRDCRDPWVGSTEKRTRGRDYPPNLGAESRSPLKASAGWGGGARHQTQSRDARAGDRPTRAPRVATCP